MDKFTPEELDEYMTACVLLPRGGDQERGWVRRRVKDDDGKPIGLRHSNPVLDTRSYEVEFADGSTEVYTANLIAENLFAQVDSEGHEHLLLSTIIGHASDRSAVLADDGFITAKNGITRPRITTCGWKLQVVG